ncbi:MAG TPA: hypothetical protein VGL75_17025 [Acidothermaceae bacterium]
MFWLALWLTATVAICVTALLPANRVALHVKFADAVSRVWRRFSPAPMEPVGPPIEDIAKSLRRLQQWLDSYADSRPIPGKATKVMATTNAYDRVLVEACRALQVPEGLEGTDGLDREAERLRMQSALVDAGLVLRGRRQAER